MDFKMHNILAKYWRDKQIHHMKGSSPNILHFYQNSLIIGHNLAITDN